MIAPVFYYDFNSPYAYLAAMRVDDVLPVRPRWPPIAFGVIVRDARQAAVVVHRASALRASRRSPRRAAERGLPPVRYPEGWPVESYSLTPLRAALHRERAGLERELSRELFALFFGRGPQPRRHGARAGAAERVGHGRQALAAGAHRRRGQERLRRTPRMRSRWRHGVPTVEVGGSSSGATIARGRRGGAA